MAEAHSHMPQGVAENYRYWGEDKTVFVDNVQGCKIIDCDGKNMSTSDLDTVQSFLLP